MSLKSARLFLVFPLLLASNPAPAAVLYVCAQTHANLGGDCGAAGNYQPLLADNGLLAVATASSDFASSSQVEAADAAVFGSDTSSTESDVVRGRGIEPMAHVEVKAQTLSSGGFPTYHAVAAAGVEIKHRIRPSDDAPSDFVGISIPMILNWALWAGGDPTQVSTAASFYFVLPGFPTVTKNADNSGNPDTRSRSGTSSFNMTVFSSVAIGAGAAATVSALVPLGGGGGAVADPFLFVDPSWEFAQYIVVEQESLENPGQWVEVTRDWKNNSSTPVAKAGDDQAVHVGGLVTLDGTGSADPDGNYPLSYAWTLKQVPAGSGAALIDADSTTPSFTADIMGAYVVELVVTDAAGWPSLPDAVMISTSNTAPVAATGADQSVILIGGTVQLDGSTSYDADGDAIGFLWSFTSKPSGSAAVLSDPAAVNPTFVADVYGQYDLSLTVTDPFGANTSDAVTVSFDNIRPVANAGVNQSIKVPITVRLDGMASSDANGDPLTYQWSMVSRPAGSSAALSQDTMPQSDFFADLPGQYVVSLTVSDGLLASDPSNVTITATSSNAAVIDVLRATVNVINGLAPASFKNPNMANALTNKIAAMIQLIGQGNYAEVLDKVNNDLLAKTDGCAAAAAPDKNDWITDCTAQAQVYAGLIEVKTLLQGMMW